MKGQIEHGVVLRAGELFLKGRNRPMFERALEDNVTRVLRRFGPLELHRGQGRLFVSIGGGGGGFAGNPPGLVADLAQVFGVVSLSPVIYVQPDLEVIGALCVELAAQGRAEGVASFRITARRPDKRFPVRSNEMNARIGAQVVAATGLRVDLGAPDLEIGIEIGPKRSFVYRGVIPGAGGLPVGVSGEAVLLISGGIDSPVAGHLCQKRGLSLTCVHFHSAPWTSAASQDKVRQLAAKLARRQAAMTLHLVPFGPIQERIRNETDESYRVVLYRRFMLRIARRIAENVGAKALVTGDCLGQVASQTLENLACIADATDMLVLRPLLGFDKTEVVALARAIGTFETSIQPHDDCCSLFVPLHPQTRGKASRARELERRLDVDRLVDEGLAGTSTELLE
jgi:thiamine biosynthesis protein ThiI